MPPEMAAQSQGNSNMRPPSSYPELAFTSPRMGDYIPSLSARMPSGQWHEQKKPPQHSPTLHRDLPEVPYGPRTHSKFPDTHAGNSFQLPQQGNRPVSGIGAIEGRKENNRKRPKKSANTAVANAANAQSGPRERAQTAFSPEQLQYVTSRQLDMLKKAGDAATLGGSASRRAESTYHKGIKHSVRALSTRATQKNGPKNGVMKLPVTRRFA